MISVVAFAVLIAAANQDWPIWTLFVSAFLAAAMPSIPAMVRARWTEIFRDRPELNTAFAFESAADELVYIAGRIPVGRLERRVVPRGRNAGQYAVPRVRIGGVHRATRDGASREAVGTWPAGSAIRQRPVQIITFALIFIGAIFATAEVSAVAITKELGQPSAASLVIGVYADRLVRRRPDHRRAEA